MKDSVRKEICTDTRAAVSFAAYLAVNFAWTLAYCPLENIGTRLFALVLLYLCMLAAYALVRLAVGGPWWMGSLAAVLMMAHPLKTDAVLSSAGVPQCGAALAALSTMALYAWHTTRPRWWTWLLSCVLLAAATAQSPDNRLLWGVLALYEWRVAEVSYRNRWRIGVIALVGLWAAPAWTPLHESWGAFLGPLWLIPYPLGLLPDTVTLLQAHPWMGWLGTAAGLCALAGAARMLRHPAFAFGLLGAVLFRFGQTDAPVDCVSLHGGGAMIVPIALGALAFSACCARVITHPKWVKPTVAWTTILCLVFFGLQARASWLCR